MKRPGTLMAKITVPANRYVPGAGTFTGDEQYQGREVVIMDEFPCDLEKLGLYPTLVYDFIVQLDDEALAELPNLFLLLNGLHETDEVSIPDFSYASRDFYVLNRRIILTGVPGSCTAIVRMLDYIYEVFSAQRLIIAPRRDTRRFFTQADLDALRQYIADKSKQLLPLMRQILAKIELCVNLARR